MGLVCASKSCPILLNEAYDAKRMDEQLAKQATAFLADPFRNKMSADKPQLSMLFKWYGGDFSNNGGTVRGFINAHSPIKIKPDAKISYLDYDWGLNEQ
jgi:xanthine dehydrogenase iron-sulfur cluster and FAD-binding subunit A